MKDQRRILNRRFFEQDTILVARRLLGKILVRRFPDGTVKRYRITETEAYCGSGDKACHASKGRTPRTEVMFGPGGRIYVYLIYGQYWLLNFVTEGEGNASAVLVRGLEGFSGPGRLGRELQLDKSFYGENMETSDRIWIEEAPDLDNFSSTPRIGINYAGEPWVSKPWRFNL
ncbi:MAG: DNA-3-methyladenine glycosylase [Mangrovibacterium sp.]